MTREELDHFLAIVDSMAGEGKTIENARARLMDEGLTQVEADLTIRVYMERKDAN